MMESRIAKLNKIAPRRIRVQAAVWVTDLHGPDRNFELEEKVRRWIAEDPRHAAAFELATEAWQRSGGLPGSLPAGPMDTVITRRRLQSLGPILAGVAVICGILGAATYYLGARTLATGPGEQRTVELSDGSRLLLNANSRLSVEYDERVRRVTLTGGEVLFDVSKHQPRPFVVVIGERKIVALGTSFMVRREQSAAAGFAVTLVEGRVAVEPISWPDDLPTDKVAGARILGPGERLRFARDSVDAVDSPSLPKVTAWQRGQLIFEDTSIGEAAEEFNRYGVTKLTIADPSVAKLRVGGVFKIGDPSSFAQAMAAAYHLRMVQRLGNITLSAQEDTAG
jgi:transmembrane sensor